MHQLSWFGIFRMGLVQTALGAIVVLTTSTMNRVMVVEWALPAMLPGLLVALHYAVQILRPKLGYDSDMGGHRTPWILGGMVVLGIGGTLAAVATAWMGTAPLLGMSLAIIAYGLIGVGVGAAGTSLLAMLAARTAPGRRAPAAAMVWLMMIAGFVVTTIVAGGFLDPFTPQRLIAVTATVAVSAVALATAAMWGLERALGAAPAAAPEDKPAFLEVFREVWDEPRARAFTIFVFVSMLAYSTQDLILEPFAGAIFGMTPGESTQLSGHQHSGVFVGMLAVAFFASGRAGPRFGSVRTWTVLGCLGSGAVLAILAVAGYMPDWPLRETVMALGFANGAFAVAAIGWMMTLAGAGRSSREGVRMGLWGGAQAVAFALGGFMGTLGVDVLRWLFASVQLSYAGVFAVEAGLFVVSALLAARMSPPERVRAPAEEPYTAPAEVFGVAGG